MRSLLLMTYDTSSNRGVTPNSTFKLSTETIRFYPFAKVAANIRFYMQKDEIRVDKKDSYP
ncbi:hypothetical protein JCM17136A_07520 [Phocaeicola sartorii JCM 17136 = DSM 21941]